MPFAMSSPVVLAGYSRRAPSGKVRAMGTSGRTQSVALPNVPTLAEAGVPGYEATIWIGMVAPKGTPQPIVDLLNREIGAATADPAIARALADLGAIALPGNADAFAAMLGEETERWRKVVALFGAHAG